MLVFSLSMTGFFKDPTKHRVGGSEEFQKRLSKPSRNVTRRAALHCSPFFSLVR